jgi:hypothetical protein
MTKNTASVIVVNVLVKTLSNKFDLVRKKAFSNLMLNIFMLSVIMLLTIILSVMAP